MKLPEEISKVVNNSIFGTGTHSEVCEAIVRDCADTYFEYNKKWQALSFSEYLLARYGLEPTK